MVINVRKTVSLVHNKEKDSHKFYYLFLLLCQSTMKKTLIAFQGPLNKKTLECAESFLELDFDIVMISWPLTSFNIDASSNIKIDILEDPGTLETNDGVSINIMRQIISNKYLLNKYSNEYDYIIRLRNDIKLTSKDLFLKQFKKALSKDKIWSVNINTTSPRLISPVLLPNHISDWFFAGTPDQLRKYLQLREVDESKVKAEQPSQFNNLIFWRIAQNEQAIWSNCWSKKLNKDQPELKFRRPWIKITRESSVNYALYLNRNFFITPFRKSGLQSIKYKSNIRTWYLNPYSLLILGSFEIFLLNRGYLNLLILYPPVLRLLFFHLRMKLLQSIPLRF